jgi:hypothetical protein
LAGRFRCFLSDLLLEIIGSGFGRLDQTGNIFPTLLISLLDPIQFLAAQLGQFLRIAAQLGNPLLVSPIQSGVLFTERGILRHRYRTE